MSHQIYDMTSQEVHLLTSIVARLSRPEGAGDFRAEVFPQIMTLLRADFLASFRWNHQRAAFEDPFIINQGDENVRRYLSWFQFNDPVSQKLRALWRPAFVDEVIARPDLQRSEFFNDFLARDGLDHGINLFPQLTGSSGADLRIWRRAAAPEFGQREIGLLNVLCPYLERAEQSLSLDQVLLLTSREREVAALVAKGCSDKDIARLLDIGFATVRTHVQKCFDKLHCSNRAELAAVVVREGILNRG